MFLIAQRMSLFGKAKTSNSKSERDLEELSAKCEEIIERSFILLMYFMYVQDEISL